jgi:hypothetical protein
MLLVKSEQSYMADLPVSGRLATSENQLFVCPFDRRAAVVIRLTEVGNSTAAVTITLTPAQDGSKKNLIYPGEPMAAQDTLNIPSDGGLIYLGPGTKIHGIASSGTVDYVIHGQFTSL